MAIEFISERHKNIIYTEKAHSLIKKYVQENSGAIINFKWNDLISKDVKELFEFVGLYENAIANIYGYENFDQLIKYKELNNLTVNDNTIKGNKKPKIDVSNFPNLITFSCDWNPKILTLGALNKLEKLDLFQYKPTSKDLTELSTLNALKILKLGSGNYENLKGLDKLESLKELRLYGNRSLKTDPNVVLESVEELYISGCTSYAHNFYKSFPNLRTLDLESSTNLESLKPILDNLKKLEEINVCGTKILEEDNSYWKDYKNITLFNFNNRKHHTLKTIDFENYPYDENGNRKQ